MKDADESEKELGEEEEEGKQPIGGGGSAMKSRKDVYSMTHRIRSWEKFRGVEKRRRGRRDF